MSPPAEPFEHYHLPAEVLAVRLLGQRLVRIVGGLPVGGTIVETEAYVGPEDLAAHSRGGRRTPRNASMYLAGGHAYVYLIYGMHHCFNVVSGPAGHGQAVLVRALRPELGIERMRRARGPRAAAGPAHRLCSGPGNLARALGIDRDLDGLDLRRSAVLRIERTRRRALPRSSLAIGPRIGVASAGSWASAPLRFCVSGEPAVSRPR